MNIEIAKNGGIALQVIWIAIIVAIIDQISKILVVSSLKPHDSIPIIQNIFHITYVQNTGAAFSVLRGRTYFFILVSSLMIIAIIYFAQRIPRNKKLLRLMLGFVLGGAVGNLIDRIRLGFVVDFFDFRIWPVFNVADSAVVVGMIVVAYCLINDPELKF